VSPGEWSRLVIANATHNWIAAINEADGSRRPTMMVLSQN
jgi:hypothetical protein